jgi:O-glycosyl hydrolase
MSFKLGLACVVAWAVSLCGAAFAASHTDVIDLSLKHQEIDNFGASDCWTMQKIGAWSDASKNRIADLLFTTDKGIGLSLWRFNIGGGITNNIRNPWRTVETFDAGEENGARTYDWSRQANERWFARAAKARGVPYLLGFANSPPKSMTRNGLTNHGNDTTSSTNLKPGMEKPYAQYLCDILEHFRNAPESERLVFDYISPVNEPTVAWETRNGQEGSRAGNADIRRMMLALHDELTSRKLPVKIRGMETNTLPSLWSLDNDASRKYGTPFGDYLKEFIADPQMRTVFDNVMCYHDYSSFEGPNVERHHRRLGEEMARYPGTKLWMSEICILHNRRDLGMDMALDVAKLIHADLVLSGASAWHWWLAVSNGDYKDGLLYTNWRRPGDEESIIESKTFWAMGNWSRFVRPGFVRVDLAGGGHAFDGLLGSAYMDPKTGKVVLVYVNVSNESQEVMWESKAAGGAPWPKSFGMWVTSDARNLERTAAVNTGATIPPRSVVSFVSE